VGLFKGKKSLLILVTSLALTPWGGAKVHAQDAVNIGPEAEMGQEKSPCHHNHNFFHPMVNFGQTGSGPDAPLRIPSEPLNTYGFDPKLVLPKEEAKQESIAKADHPHTVSRPSKNPPPVSPSVEEPKSDAPLAPDYSEENELKHRQWLRERDQQEEEEYIRPFPVSVFPAAPESPTQTTPSNGKRSGTISRMQDDLNDTILKISALETERENSLMPNFLWDMVSGKELRILKGYAQGIIWQLEIFAEAEANGKDGIQAINDWRREQAEMFVNAMNEHLQIMGGALTGREALKQAAQHADEILKRLDFGRKKALFQQGLQQAKASTPKSAPTVKDFMPGGKLRPVNAPSIESAAAAREVRPDSPVKAMAQNPTPAGSEATPNISKNVTKLKNMYSPPGLTVNPHDSNYAQKFFDAGGVRPEGWQIDHVPAKAIAKVTGERCGLFAVPGKTNNAYSPFDAHQAKKANWVAWKGGDPGPISDANKAMHSKPPPKIQPLDSKTQNMLKMAADTGAEGYKGAPSMK